MTNKMNIQHPQPSSYKKARESVKRIGVRNDVVLDCFCGTCTHLCAALDEGAPLVIGTDIEDWSDNLYTEFRKYINCQTLFDRKVVLEWGIDAKKSVIEYEYDLLFIDPPNPYLISGGPIGAQKRRYPNLSWFDRSLKNYFSDENMIKKGRSTIRYTKNIIDLALEKNKKILVNLFSSEDFSYLSSFSPIYYMEKVFKTYYLIHGIKDGDQSGCG